MLSALPSHGRSDSGVGNTPLPVPDTVWEQWPSPADVEIPAAADWTDQGEVLPAGAAGEWDHYIFGAMNQVSVQKRDGTLYLFYVASDGTRSGDGGPANRRLGVATSQDGLTWSKAAENPIIDDAIFDDVEEGIFGGGIWPDSGTLQMMLGVMEGAQGAVDGSGDLYTSGDGISVSLDTRDVIDPDDGRELGTDERFPLAAYERDGTRYVFFVGKGGDLPSWRLVVASGPSWDSMTTYTSLYDGGNGPITHGQSTGGTIIKKTSSTYLLPLHENTVGNPNRTHLYSFDPTDPHDLTAWGHPFDELDSDVFGQELETDLLPDGARKEEGFCMFLDRDLEKWFAYYDVDAATNSGLRALTADMVTV